MELIYLSPKQYQIVQMICCRALRNRAIAEELHTTEQCIKNHFKHVLAKIGIEDRLALCVWYYNGGRERLKVRLYTRKEVPVEVLPVVVEVVVAPVVSAAEILRRQGVANAKS